MKAFHVALAFMAIVLLIPFIPSAQANVNTTAIYRRAVTVSASSSLTGYQVSFTIDHASLVSAGKSRSDAGDIRLKFANGTELPYWIEPQTINTSSMRIWTKLDLPAGDTTFYLYYGDLSLTSEANGTAVFELFDDFDGSSLSSVWGTTSGSYSISNGEITLTNPAYITSASTFGSGYALRVRAEVGTDTSGNEWVTFCSSAGVDSNSYMKAVLRNSGDANGEYEWNSGDGSNYQLGNFPVALDTAYHTLDIIRNGTTNDVFLLDDGNQQVGSYPTSSAWYVELHAGTADLVADWVFVRRYSYPEPEVSVGSEEALGTHHLTVHVYEEEQTDQPLSVTITAEDAESAKSVNASSWTFYSDMDIDWVSISRNGVVRTYYTHGLTSINTYMVYDDSMAVNYQFQVSRALGAQAEDEFYVKKGDLLISSGLLPSNLVFSCMLIYGRHYTVEVHHGSSVWSWSVQADGVTSKILSYPLSPPDLTPEQISYSTNRNTTHAFITYGDGYSATESGSKVGLYYTLPGGTGNSLDAEFSLGNSSEIVATLTEPNATYVAVFDVNHGVLGPQHIVRGIGYISNPIAMNWPDIGLGEILPGITMPEFFSMGLIVLIAAVFSQLFAPVGVVLIGMLTLLFIYWGWMPLNLYTIATVVVSLGILYALSRDEGK